MSALATGLFAAGSLLNVAGIAFFFRAPWPDASPFCAAGFTLWTAFYLMQGRSWLAVFYGAIAAAHVWLWWTDRRLRRRKRAPRLAGYKARALIASLVRRAREAAKPRPVLRPVPGAAS